MMARMTKLLLVLCVVLSASGCDRSAAAEPTKAAGSATSASCSMAATWTGTYSCPGFLAGKKYTWAMKADGTATGSIEGLGSVQQTWKLDKNVLTITEHNDQCKGDGKYTVSWGASCGTMSLVKISDACASRGACVDKLTSTRSK
jgi:hypothetical protein